MPPKTSSRNADQPPSDEVVADLGSLPTWPKHLDAKRYEVLVVATRVPKKWDAANQKWITKLSWTLESYTKIVVDESKRHDRAYVLLLADAFLFKSMAQDLPALTSAVVADPKFKAGFDKLVAMYNASAILERLEQSKQRYGLTAGLAALRENAVEECAAEAKMLAIWNAAPISAAWTQDLERAKAAAAFAAFRVNDAMKRAAAAIAAAEAKAATAARDAEALANGLEGLGMKTPGKPNSKSIASALERVRTPKAGEEMPSPPVYFKSETFQVKCEADFPYLAPPAGNNDCMTRPAGAANNTSYINKEQRRLSTGFGRKVRTVEQAPPKEGEAPFLNNYGVAVTPGAPEIGAPMESSLQLRKKWQDSPQSLGPKRC